MSVDEAVRYAALIVGALCLLIFIFGLLLSLLHTMMGDTVPDYVEKALEEVTRKRKRK